MARTLAAGRRDTKLGTTPSGKVVWLEKHPSEYKGWSPSDHLYAAVIHKANRTRGREIAELHAMLAGKSWDGRPREEEAEENACSTHREIAMSRPRSSKCKAPSSKHLLTTNRLIVVESDGDRDTMTWSAFADANREMPELEDVAAELRRYGRATVGGGASPFTVVRLDD